MSNQYGGQPPQQPPANQPDFANPYAGVPGIPPHAGATGQPPYAQQAQHAQQPPHPQQPPHGQPAPYAQQPPHAQQPQQLPHGQQAQYAQQPPYPRPPARSGLSGGAIAGIVIGAVVLVALVVGVIAVVLVLGPPARTSGAPTAPLVPTATAPVPGPDVPVEPEESSGTEEPSADEATNAKTKEMLTELRAKYADTGADAYLWQQIPKTPDNEGAAQAFAYAIADLQAACIWGPSESKLREYEADAKEYERRLLAQEPLGISMEIGRGDGTTFHYDGDTGETSVTTDG